MNDREEGKGMRLLRKGKRGLIQAIFSRLGLIVLLFLLQLALLLGLFSAAAEFLPHFFGGTIVFNAIIVIYLLNSEGDPTAKLTWLVFFSVAPVFGALFYLYTKSDIGHRLLRERTTQLIREGRSDLRAHASAQQHLEERDPQIARMASYIAKSGCYPVWEHTAVTYFPLGEDKFAALLPALRQAKHFIFLEYFIVEEGEMWGQVLSILVEKVKQGVEVRVLVDGTCEFTHLTHDYPRRMQELGIKCKMFAPVRPFVSTHYNYRDHRKIAVIDGQVAFTGGVNLADEYINRKQRCGVWKDTGLMLKGPGVYPLTVTFLKMWDFVAGTTTPYTDYMPLGEYEADGYVQPYCDSPLDGEAVAESAYLNVLQHARDYVYIVTPYLIVDNEMVTALCLAAKSGVDVRILTPGVPDKWYVYYVTQSYYPRLLEAGVRIYEYTPGFLHAKCYVSDDHLAVVGSINMDYRSLFLHFECGVLLQYNSQVAALRDDVRATLPQCREIHISDCRTSIPGTLLDSVLRLLSPLIKFFVIVFSLLNPL